jgi:hypothetical protein
VVHEPAGPDGGHDGTPGAQHAEATLRREGHQHVDQEDRALFVDRVVAADLTVERYAAGAYAPLASWARTRMRCRVSSGPDEVVVRLEPERWPESFSKEIAVSADGRVRVRYRLGLEAPLSAGLFAPELSFGAALEVRLTPDAPLWRYPIETVAKSERGLEKTVQGESVTPRWTASSGEFIIELLPPAPGA